MALDLWNRAYDQEEESRAFFNAKLVDRAWQVGELSPLSLQELLQTGCEVVLERIPGTPFGTPAPGTPGLCAGGQRVASSVVLVFWCLGVYLRFEFELCRCAGHHCGVPDSGTVWCLSSLVIGCGYSEQGLFWRALASATVGLHLDALSSAIA